MRPAAEFRVALVENRVVEGALVVDGDDTGHVTLQ